MDGEGLRINVGEESARNVGGILGIFVEEKSIVDADLAGKRVGYLATVVGTGNVQRSLHTAFSRFLFPFHTFLFLPKLRLNFASKPHVPIE